MINAEKFKAIFGRQYVAKIDAQWNTEYHMHEDLQNKVEEIHNQIWKDIDGLK